MNTSNTTKYWRWLIYIVCALIMVLPISETLEFLTEESNGEWRTNFVINTIEFAIFIIPLISFLLLIPRIEKPIKGILIIFTFIISGFISYVSFQSLVFLAQDFMPDYGMLLSFFFFPIVIINSIIEWKQK